MKKIALSLLLFVSLFVKAQDYPGKMPQLLFNKEVTLVLNESIKKYGYRNFYKDSNAYEYYAGKTTPTVPYEKLMDRTFKVTEMKPHRLEGYYILTITDGTENIYYMYSAKSATDYYFVVKGGLDYPADFYADRIKKTVSEELGEVKFESDKVSGFDITKTIYEDAGIGYTLGVVVPCKEYHLDAKKVTLNLGDGNVITKTTDAISVTVSGANFVYFVTLLLNDKELELLKNSPIVRKSVEDDCTDTVSDGKVLQGMINYITTLN